MPAGAKILELLSPRRL